MSRVIYTKYSNERGRCFSVCTQLVQEEDKSRKIVKRPAFSEAAAFVEHIADSRQTLEELYRGTDVEINACTRGEGEIVLEYLEGKTLEEELDELLGAGKESEAKELMCQYLDQLADIYGKEPFQKTAGFEELFPGVEIPQGSLAASAANLDVIVQNLMLCKEKKVLIDYEWTVDFPVPVTFLLYRVIFYFQHEHETRAVVREWGLYERYQIDERLQELYAQMEQQFQRYILQDYTPIRELFEEISPGVVPLSQMKLPFRESRTGPLQIFQKATPDFAEDDAVTLRGIPEGQYREEILLAPQAKYLRIDPCTCPCALREVKLTWESGRTAEYTAVGAVRAGEQDWIFGGNDPQLLLRCDGTERRLTVSFSIQYFEEGLAELFDGVEKIRQKQEKKIARLEEKIRQMEQTKVWKAYEKYKAMRK